MITTGCGCYCVPDAKRLLTYRNIYTYREHCFTQLTEAVPPRAPRAIALELPEVPRTEAQQSTEPPPGAQHFAGLTPATARRCPDHTPSCSTPRLTAPLQPDATPEAAFRFPPPAPPRTPPRSPPRTRGAPGTAARPEPRGRRRAVRLPASTCCSAASKRSQTAGRPRRAPAGHRCRSRRTARAAQRGRDGAPQPRARRRPLPARPARSPHGRPVPARSRPDAAPVAYRRRPARRADFSPAQLQSFTAHPSRPVPEPAGQERSGRSPTRRAEGAPAPRTFTSSSSSSPAQRSPATPAGTKRFATGSTTSKVSASVGERRAGGEDGAAEGRGPARRGPTPTPGIRLRRHLPAGARPPARALWVSRSQRARRAPRGAPWERAPPLRAARCLFPPSWEGRGDGRAAILGGLSGRSASALPARSGRFSAGRRAQPSCEGRGSVSGQTARGGSSDRSTYSRNVTTTIAGARARRTRPQSTPGPACPEAAAWGWKTWNLWGTRAVGLVLG